jgi:hypothetical protein
VVSALIGEAGLQQKSGFYGVLSMGGYFSTWKDGYVTPSSGIVPPKVASGAGPSGIAFGAGLGWAATGRTSVEVNVRQFSAVVSGRVGALNLAVLRNW